MVLSFRTLCDASSGGHMRAACCESVHSSVWTVPQLGVDGFAARCEWVHSLASAHVLSGFIRQACHLRCGGVCRFMFFAFFNQIFYKIRGCLWHNCVIRSVSAEILQSTIRVYV